jgi:cytochrome c oxidase subunit IV
MSAHSTEEISRHVKIYVTVFIALLVGTIVTVLMNAIHFESMAITITIALFIAVIKAALVAGFFMHLISERKAIYAILAATAFFFAGMMYLVVWSREEIPVGTLHIGRGDSRPVPGITAESIK